jgi:hypothetical protein
MAASIFYMSISLNRLRGKHDKLVEAFFELSR